MSRLQPTLFDGARMLLPDAFELTCQSLAAYGALYRHWAIAYSGGKDSTALVTAICHGIKTGRIQPPLTLTVLMSDTRLELPPLFATAMQLLAALRAQGVRTQVVMPPMDRRFFVYMLGRGVPPPSNSFRWCTGKLKIEPMIAALTALRTEHNEKFLMLTGVRIGESAVRDARIALSCGKNNSECGQGWYQEATPEKVADTLAPLLHWRLCHVWDWLMGFVPADLEHGYPTQLIAEVYGQDEALEDHARTGCISCNLVGEDLALSRIIKKPQWAHFAPLKEMRDVYAELKKPHLRLRKDGTERRKDGEMVANPCRMGPLTFEARLWALDRILDIQSRARVDLIDAEEEARIRELIAAQTWPEGWDGTEPLASDPFENVFPDGSIQSAMLDILSAGRPINPQTSI